MDPVDFPGVFQVVKKENKVVHNQKEPASAALGGPQTMIAPSDSQEARKLFRVILRANEYLGTSEQWHAKIVAPNCMDALSLALENLEIDPSKLDGSAITLLDDSTDLANGRVFDVARRARAFGERGAWVFREDLPERVGDGPRETELL